MKKIAKLFAVAGMMSLLISFVGCDMATEADLNSGIGNTEDTSPTVTAPESSEDEDTETDSGKKGTNKGSSSDNSDEEDVSTSDTIGDAWGAMFSSTDHNPIDLQVWQGFDAEFDNEYGMKAEILPGAWFGGAIVQNCSAEVVDSLYYDMSEVKKVTFKVKASMDMAIWAGYSNKSKAGDLEKVNVNVTTDWKTITISSEGVKRAWAIFAFGSDGVSEDAWIAFKDVTYYDEDGNSVALKYIK